MEDNIQKIKDRVDIVDLVSSYLKLQKAGVNYKAKCPFHNEKTPSFSVSAERQIWHCFGCGEGGDHFSFVQKIEGADFPEALRILAKRAGVELDNFDRSFQNEKTKLLEICGLASRFFQKQLWESKTGQKVLAYLKDRGLKDESVKIFQLGYAPESWDSLGNFLKSKGYRDQEIFNSGLSIKRDSQRNGYYDRFRGRITFPIADSNGQVVGFTGRVFEQVVPARQEVGAKYINTPQTLIYDKSRVLYGLDKAKLEIRKKDRCVVVEGNMDVILSHQVGATNTVASSGTALTNQHLKIIKRYTSNLDLCFDQDLAGANATEKGIALALGQGFNVDAVRVDDPMCKDPADYVKEYGAKWLERLEDHQPIPEFYLNSALKKFDANTALGKKLVAEKVLAIIKNMPNQVEQSHWIGELALKLKTREDVLVEQMSRGTTGNVGFGRFQQKEAGNVGIRTLGSDALEDCLISLLLVKPDLISEVSESDSEFYTDKIKAVFNIFKNYLSQNSGEKPIEHLVKNISSGALDLERMYLEKLYLQAVESWSKFSEPELKASFSFVGKHLLERNIKNNLSDLELTIRQAEKSGNKNLVSNLIKNFQTTADYLNKIKNI